MSVTDDIYFSAGCVGEHSMLRRHYLSRNSPLAFSMSLLRVRWWGQTLNRHCVRSGVCSHTGWQPCDTKTARELCLPSLDEHQDEGAFDAAVKQLQESWAPDVICASWHIAVTWEQRLSTAKPRPLQALCVLWCFAIGELLEISLSCPFLSAGWALRFAPP